MWEIDFSSQPPDSISGDLNPHHSQIDIENIESVLLLNWREHCVECAPPSCYGTCELFVERADRRCARLQYGMYPNKDFRGLFDYGADVSFRRWAFIGAKLSSGAVSLPNARRIENINRMLVDRALPLSTASLRPFNHDHLGNLAFVKCREVSLNVIRRLAPPSRMKFDEFLIEVWNPSDQDVQLIVEASQDNNRFRTSLTLRPGANLHAIPAERMQIDTTQLAGTVKMLPDHDAEVRLIFTWADFVRYAKKRKYAPIPATTVKCVAWDLDGTLWDGTLVEDGSENLALRPGVKETIIALDQRGIIQSIASKNDHDAAWSALSFFGLDEFFVYPAINWGPKSESLKAIAQDLNINLDTFAFIDDSPNERAQVGSELPQVRVFETFAGVLDRPEFDLPITEASKRRRESYQTESVRKKEAASFGANQIDFLTDCELVLSVFRPTEQTELDRCYELMQRTNQLNLSNRQYDDASFRDLLSDPEVMVICSRVKDRFGDYGIIGFAAVRMTHEGAILVDFVQSCRVARKKVENAWFHWLQTLLLARDYETLQTVFIPTERNAELRSILDEVGFEEFEGKSEGVDLTLLLETPPPFHSIVAVDDKFAAGHAQI